MPSANTDLAAALGAVLDAFGQLLRVRKPKIHALARKRMYPVRRIPAPRLGTGGEKMAEKPSVSHS
jgi:hypothetical protein